ncbi:ATP-binding protein [Maribacter sp. MAR_2009_72]|uniref:sensor histidine kinase n=1 Tax=Maribacter sp. MAR_2009_72 TaxID=1250050 RepID=UPI001199E624|nr:ATP-binding protein [Maribacter sp. MAR_2009_72]TVZ14650.1 two component regulator with propeller domain [Maribacter sp. MAR_2009_72]
MKNTQQSKLVLIIGFFCCLFLVSCHKQSKSETETTVGDYKVPETIPLQFTEPEPFEWETITNDTVTTPVAYDLDVDALPNKPFELNTFKPLKSPMKEYDLDWDNFPVEDLKFDTVSFTITKSTIKKPTITKIKPLGNMAGTNVNLLQLSSNEGLLSNDITSFLETEDGGIWIASSSSASPLTLYDGENAFIYDYNTVYKMEFDKQGKLWLVRPADRIIHVLDFDNNIEYTITRTENFTPFDILCDHLGTMYIASLNEGFYTIDPELRNMQKITNINSSKPWRLFEDSNNNLWLGFTNHLAILDKDRKELKTLSRIADIEINSIVWDITEDQLGNIWLNYPYPSTNNNNANPRVFQLSLKENTIKLLDAENAYDIIGTEIVEDNKGNIWILGAKEAYILSNNLEKYKTILLNSTLQGSLKIPRPLKRKDGSLWIATTDNGVLITTNYTLQTEYFDDTRGLINEEIWEIEEDSNGDIWLGTAAGINIINLKNKSIKALSFQQLHCNPNTISFIKEITPNIYFINTRDGFSILDRKKSKITSYANSAAVFGAGIAIINEHTFAIYANKGLYVYNIENNSFKKVVSKNDPDILIAGSGSIMVYDKEILWIPTTNGLAKVNLKTNTVSYLREEQGLSNNNVSIAKISNEGELWLATANGINILNLEQNTLTSIKKENGLYPTDFYDLTEKGGMMYAASGNGLIAVEKASAKTTDKGFYNFNGGLGFKSNDYLQNSPKFLKNGQFWSGVTSTSSEWKLLVLNSEPHQDSTISSVQINSMFVMDENPGFGFNLKKDSTKVQTSTYASTNSITWDSVKRPYNLPQGLILPYDQNSISFSYGSNDIFNRDKLNYRFILDGEDEDWSYAANATKTKNYYNLKPGNYTFKVAVRNSIGNWSDPDSLSFKINPPWWQTWWAYLLFGLIAASILRAYIVFRARKLTKENRILEERVSHRTVQLKTKIDELKSTQSKLIQSEKMASLGELTAGIAHEIQNPLNFVNNFSEVNKELLEEMVEEIENGNYDEVKALAKDVSDNEDKIIFHGKRADGIVKGMLQHSRSSTGQKELTNINTLSDEYLRLAYHGLRAKDKSFNATLNTNFDDSIGKLNIVAQDMGRVILNLITNAFYVVKKKKEENPNGYEPTVSVTTEKKDTMVFIKVSDNGNGVPKEVLDKIFQPFFTTKPSGEGTGLGLSLSYDIVKVHGGELTVDTKQGEGTTFTIALPIK